MKKILLFALILVFGILINTNAQAQTRPGTQPVNQTGGTTPSQTVSRPGGQQTGQACRVVFGCEAEDRYDGSTKKCIKTDGSSYDASQKVDTNPCPAGQQPDSDDISVCKCTSNAGTVKRTQSCSGENCSKGTGQRCWIAPGSADDGKLIPPGTTPAAGTQTGIFTAIGCIPSEPRALVNGLLKYGTLGAGGIAFLLMLLAALQMITAEGNPQSIKTAQERFYSAIIGLLFIIFSVLLLQVIGFDVLGLKGFSR